MSDAPIEPTENPHEVDIEKPIEPDEIAAAARANFSLKDRLRGIKHRHAKVLLFTDPEAADAYHSLNARAQANVDAAGDIKDFSKPGAQEMHDTLIAEYNKLEEGLEAAKQEMLESALSVHLQAYPNIVAKVARRDGVKKFKDPVQGRVPADKQAEYVEWVEMALLGHSIVKIVDATGAELDLGDRNELGMALSNDLPSSQWDRLYQAFTALVVTDQIGDAATDDPGF